LLSAALNSGLARSSLKQSKLEDALAG